ncbi:hypothetical protein JKP88DRAFT_204655 [Tribonema minus]|uniref:Uncharacterized protein n=1 Tax=Tribonema minus TaxID=303371 RepID=A0A835ZC81_9STRA|nr:hypothetical protein JKP88DRAFT_204655 [Tribonema minus]
MDEDDSDDNVPLAALKQKNAKGKEAVATAKRKAADDKKKVADKAAAKAKASAKKPAEKTKKAAAAAKASPKKAAKATPKRAAKPAVQRKALVAEEDETDAADLSGAGRVVTRSSVLADTDKGELVKKLLCRWWYAIEWPKPEDFTQPSAPPNYEALDGYPGLYICVRGDESIGKLFDARRADTKPSFANFSRKPCAELKDLLRAALTAQREQLREHWGKAPPTHKHEQPVKGAKGSTVRLPEKARAQDRLISDELKWLEKVDAAGSDKRAQRALAKAGFKE